MSSQTCLLLILAILTNLSAAVTAQNYGCFGGNYTSNGTYSANLISLLSSLPANITDNGYYNATAGQAPDRVYASALCRTDFQLEECRSCLREAIAPLLQSLCPNWRQGIFFRQMCTLRYSDEPISGGAGAQSYSVLSGSVRNVSSPEQFNQQLRVLLRELRGQAAAGGPLMKIAAGNETAPDFQTMFVMVQCVPDLSAAGCADCLIRAEQLLCCGNNARIALYMPGCYLEYSIEPFYNISRIEQVRAMIAEPLSPPSSPGNNDGNSTRIVIIILVPIAASLLISACVGNYVRKRLKKKAEHISLDEEEEDVSAEQSLIFDFEELVAATNNFSNRLKIGQGGFGAVYKGKLRSGQRIAVKRLSMSSKQGELEFKNEVVLMVKLQHKNLVSGYMAPEYARNGHFSMKSDVFSFGVLVLEIISGQSNSSFKNVENGENVDYMLSFAWRNWRAGTAKKMIDPALMSASASRNDMLRCIHIGLLCVQENASDRPTMASVVVMLHSLSYTFPVPLQPGFFVPSSDDEIKATEFSRNEATIKGLNAFHGYRLIAQTQTTMSSQTCLLLILAILTNLSASVTAQNYGCFGGNYTANGTYSTNLISLISSLAPNITDNAYYNATSGQAPDQVYASALCRTDFQLEECRSCLRGAIAPLLQSLCPNRRQGIFFRQACTLRYSDEPISGGAGAQSYSVRSRGVQNLSSPEQFNQQLRVLLRELRAQAAAGGPLMKIAAGNGTAPDFQTMFAMMQCVPDLSAAGCADCLIRSEQMICCDNSRIEQVRAMIAAPLSPPVQAPVTRSSPGNDDGNSTRTVIIILVPIVASLLIAACVGTYASKRLKKKTEHITLQRLDEEEYVSAEESLIFDFEELLTATNNFSDSHKIGQGGFGAVYKGKLRKGQQIAVKRLSRNSEQGELEFKNEVVLMVKLQHKNLVRLLGFSLRGPERLLVYEFVHNGSLDCSVFDPMKRLAINWDVRYTIIKGIAKGLVYLHEDSRLRVIHRDLKASNVLLDEDNNPKISDFGMARLFTQDETRANTRRIVGTYGYMAPEYARNGHFSMKSDVFSFGVLVLEIISGQSNNSFKNVENGENVEYMLSFAWRNWRAGTAKKMIDPALMSASASRNDMLRCIHIGLLCVQENAKVRPTMASVVVMLNSLSSTFPVPLQPGFFVPSSNDEIRATEFSRNEATISDLYPR
ncbi:hypothetical protein SASPL_157039 [Salvia splendens]|uniref:Uncharacterized protein n=1 Tax=Salvia splendens TaxID=180675 RepID=A0A8X8YUV9_SALSN|nr:hypothetical protein SASPL_157039 [Salvia splendens]